MTDKKRERQREYNRRYYLNNKPTAYARAEEGRKKAKAAWAAWKSTLSCSYCGESHPATLDFHHIIKDNKQSINRLLAKNAFRAAKEEAVEKCIVLCSNCHRKIHYNERQNPERE